jgi:Asp/Glu/hydantoin racemase
LNTANEQKYLELYTYTAPSDAPPSINNGEDVEKSAEIVYQNLKGKLSDYDAVLVACFSVHPLVHALARDAPHVSVTGIFEASVLACLPLLSPPVPSKGSARPMCWGIVTTGKFWEQHLSDGVKEFLGQEKADTNHKFAGVQSTGLDAGDFHGGVDPAVIRQKLEEATARLLKSAAVECVVMGCAGMAGLEEIIRSVARREYGKPAGDKVFIVDGIKAGIGLLEQTVRNRKMFQS